MDGTSGPAVESAAWTQAASLLSYTEALAELDVFVLR